MQRALLWLWGLRWGHWLHCLPHCLPPAPCPAPLPAPAWAHLGSALGECLRRLRSSSGLGKWGGRWMCMQSIEQKSRCSQVMYFWIPRCCLFDFTPGTSVTKERCCCATLFTMKGRLCGHNMLKQCNVSTHTYSWTWRTQISIKTSPWPQQLSVEPCLGMLPLWVEPWVKPGDGDLSLQWWCLLCCLLGSSTCQLVRKRTK